jgi:hypothetical protein
MIYVISEVVICTAALVLAAVGYQFQIGTAWTDAADVILRSWFGILLVALVFAWSSLHFETIRRMWIDPEFEREATSYFKHHLAKGQVIPNELILPICAHIGVAYFSAQAQRYDLVVIVLAGIVALVAAVHEMRKAVRRTSA